MEWTEGCPESFTTFRSRGYKEATKGSVSRTNVTRRVYLRASKSFYREAVIWKRLSHPNIVPFLGIAQSKTPFLCMVSSWMENGNLAMFLKKQPGANRLDLVSERNIIRLRENSSLYTQVADIARGLKYLHELLIVHGDVKSVNSLEFFTQFIVGLMKHANVIGECPYQC